MIDYILAMNMLQDTKGVLDKNGIPFCLFFGTLLGAIRDGDFMEHDDDIDIVVMAKDITRKKMEEMNLQFKEIGYSTHSFGGGLLCGGFYVIGERNNKNLRLDVCILFDFKDKLWFTRIAKKDDISFVVAIPYKKRYFENMKTVNIRGTEYRVPTPPEEFLTEMWHDWQVVKKTGQFGYIPNEHFSINEFKPKEVLE